MILKSKTQTKTAGLNNASSFQIKTTSKAFKILSDGLYSNKIKAVIRELSTNAVDSHVEANNMNQKFNVQLPTYLEPIFKIRDFGTGISPENILNIYTVYFESTKDDSNDYIGALGLGSKSPFSYVDCFSVISFYNGIRYVYSAFINENGIPDISLIDERNTEEKNGIEISFPVKNNDVSRFKEEAKFVYKYFNTVKPDINININYKTHNTIINDIYFSDLKSYNYKINAILGSIAYPIDLEIIKKYINKIENKDNQKKLKHILKFTFDLKFNLGELDINPSRESLSYDENTIQNIIDKLLKTVDILDDYSLNKINNSLNEFNKIINYHEYFFIIYNDKKRDIIKKESIQFDKKALQLIKSIRYMEYNNYKVSSIVKYQQKNNNSPEIFNLKVNTKTLYIINDNKNKFIVNTVKNLAIKNQLNVYLIETDILNKDYIETLMLGMKFIDINDFYNEYYIAPIKKNYTYTKSNAYYDFTYKPYSQIDYVPTKVTTKTYYFKIYRGQMLFNGSEYKLHHASNIIYILKLLNIIDEDANVFGIKTKETEKKSFNKNFILLESIKFKKSDFTNIRELLLTINPNVFKLFNYFSNHPEIYNKFPNKGIKQIINKYKETDLKKLQYSSSIITIVEKFITKKLYDNYKDIPGNYLHHKYKTVLNNSYYANTEDIAKSIYILDKYEKQMNSIFS